MADPIPGSHDAAAVVLRDVLQPDPPDDEALLRTAVVGRIVADVVTERTQAVRAALIERLGRGGQIRRNGLGVATVSDPPRAALVTDEAAFAAWLADNRPDMVKDGPPRVTVRDHGGVADAVAQLRRWLNDPDATVQPLAAAAAVVDGLDVTTAVHIADDAVDVLLADHPGDPERPELPRLGPLLTADGEVIPGVEVGYRSRPSLTVTPDRQGAERLRRTLLPSAPALVEGDV